MYIIMEIKEEKEKDKEELIKSKPKINTKDELIIIIKDWIKMDNDITKLKAELRDKKHKQEVLTKSLANVMKTNSIDSFDIKGGELVYKQKKTNKPISCKFLLSQLEEYYKEQPELAKEITKKVLDNREKVLKDEIKIKKTEK